MATYEYEGHPEWEGMSPQQLPDWYNKGYGSQSEYLQATQGSAQPTVAPIPNNQLEGLTSQQIMPQQQALLTPEQQAIVQNTDQQVAFQNTPAPTPAPQQQPAPAATPQSAAQPNTPTGMIETPANMASMTWDQRMEYLRQNPQALASEIQRAMNNAQYLSSQGQEAPDQLKYIQSLQSLGTGQAPFATQPAQPPTPTVGGDGQPPIVGGQQTGEQLQGTGTSQTGEFQSQYTGDITSRLDALEQMMNKPVDITQSPFYQSMMQLAEQNGNIAAQRTMEQLNARGILNSTITAYNVAQAKQQAIVQVMPQILKQAYDLRQDEIDNIMDQVNQYIKLDQEDYDRYLAGEEAKAKKELREYERAWDRSEATGFISNDDAIILGIAPGPTFQYQKWMAEELYKQQKYVDDLAVEKEKLKLDQEKAAETKRHNRASESRLAKSGGSGSSSSADLTPSGYYSGFPGITPAVEKELDMTKEQIAAGAREAGVTNSQYISQARDIASSKAYYAIADSIVEAAKLYRQQNNKMLPAEEAMKVVDANVAQGLLNKEDEKNLRQWVTDSFGF